MLCCHFENDITIVDRSVIFSNKIGTITFNFCTKNSTKKIFLFEICYCNKFDTKLIFLKMLNCKSLSFFSLGGVLEVQDKKLSIMLDYLTIYNLYKVHLEDTITNLMTIF